MYVTNGFVYYFTIFVAFLNIFMAVFAIRSIRRIFFNLVLKYKLRDNAIVNSIIYLIFAIIIFILIDSLWTYFTLKNLIESDTYGLLLNDYSVFQRSMSKKDYMSMFRVERQFYMAQRNFMLTASAFIVSFLNHSFTAGFAKLNDIENQIDIYRAKVKAQ